MANDSAPIQHSGGCHCGQVRFFVQTHDSNREDARLAVKECNCSICQPVGYLHLIVPAADFSLQSSWQDLSLYTFNSGIAQHWFCPSCGIKSFYRPRSHPAGISVNARCLDDIDLSQLAITPFDGRNWEQNLSQLAPLPNPE